MNNDNSQPVQWSQHLGGQHWQGDQHAAILGASQGWGEAVLSRDSAGLRRGSLDCTTCSGLSQGGADGVSLAWDDVFRENRAQWPES